MDDLNRPPLSILENHSGFDSVFELNPFFSSIDIFLSLIIQIFKSSIGVFRKLW